MTISIDGDVFVIYVFYLFLLSILRNANILYFDIYELLMVNYMALTEKTFFKLKFNIKTWLKILKNLYLENQVHITETNEQRIRRFV